MSFTSAIRDYMKSGESKSENLGLEVEHFVVNEEGFPMGFEEISKLIDEVAERIGAELIYMDGYPVGYTEDRYIVTLEPSCQFEISINPYSDLSKIESIYRDFISLWEPIFADRGYHLVNKGVLPLVEQGSITPDDIPLSPKKRYKYMDAYFRNSGRFGKYMMRASSSAQVSVDYRSEEDLVRKLRLLQQISPVLAIMMESKTREDGTLPGEDDKPHLLRIQEWDDLDPARTGFFPGSFDDDFGYAKAADAVYHTPLILLTDNGVTTDIGSKCAGDLFDEGIIREEEIDEKRKKKLVEHFLSMGFFHFRIKKYIEIRVADSVPIEKAMAYVALLKGIIYSKDNIEALEKELAGVDEIGIIEDAVLRIEREGLKARIYNNMTAAQWISHLAELAGNGLPPDEKEYLGYV